MNRREFMSNVTAASVTALGVQGWSARPCAAESSDAPSLKGFIVSDAHFGWNNEQQPMPEEQRRAMAHIRERFPDLDVFIDTGDVHHGNLRGAAGDAARRDWTDIIANGAGALPFLFVPGNHEIIGSAEGDHEDRCCRLGSIPCRPYYSFDLKNIHFISLPEMIRAVYVTRETLEWLALDLAVHRDKTTIILSHNNITETTGPYEDGYRGVVNSDALTELFARNPQVIAWMHGHNHNYEVVSRPTMVYVSNGRIGGFDPSSSLPEGTHGLGGIYFSVDASGLTVRSYSADRACFLDELDIDAVSAVLDAPTSLDVKLPAAWCYGYGGARHGQRVPVHHHLVGRKVRRTLYLKGVSDAAFNDDPAFALYAARGQDNPNQPTQKMLMGSEVRGRDVLWHWENPGIVIEAPKEGGAAVQFAVPRGGNGQVAYLRCPPGNNYLFRLQIVGQDAGGVVRLSGVMTDTLGNVAHRAKEEAYSLTEGAQTLSYRIEIPESAGRGSIYRDQESDVQTQLIVTAGIEGMTHPVRVVCAELLFEGAGEKTINPGIRLNGNVYEAKEDVGGTVVRQLPLDEKKDNREVVECIAEGARRMTWLVREEHIEMQVRNAVARMRDGWLEVGPVRAEWMQPPVIVIALMSHSSNPCVWRLENITRARIHQEHGSITVEVPEHREDALVQFLAQKAPTEIKGGLVRDISEGCVTVQVTADRMNVIF